MLKTASGRGYRLVWALRQESTSSADSIDLEPVRSPAEPIQTNLPAAASDLIGRTTAVQHLCELLAACRVVTLTGAGGIGKTKPALEVVRGLLPSFQGDVRPLPSSMLRWQLELAGLLFDHAERHRMVLGKFQPKNKFKRDTVREHRRIL